MWPPVLAWLGARSVWPVFAFLGVNQAVNFGMLDSALSAVGLPYAALSILQVTFTPIPARCAAGLWNEAREVPPPV